MLRKGWLVFVLAGLTIAATQTGTVRSGSQAIPGASVTADCGGQIISTVTDAAGHFEMGGLPAAPCKLSVGMFGFEPLQRDAAASSSPLILDLKLQTHATLPPSETPVTVANPQTPPPAAKSPTVPAEANQASRKRSRAGRV